MIYEIGYFFAGVLLIVAIIIALTAEVKVTRTIKKYKDENSSLDLTGAELARKLAEMNGLNIRINMCKGTLTDHYNPQDKSLNISEANYNSKSIVAQSIVAHEFGHALQDQEAYKPLKIRQFAIKASNIYSRMIIPLLIVGFLFELVIPYAGIVTIYALVVLYAVSFAVNLITLPVEYNASSRAKKLLYELGCTSDREKSITDKTLDSAALTYVGSLLISLAYFLRLLFILLSLADR